MAEQNGMGTVGGGLRLDRRRFMSLCAAAGMTPFLAEKAFASAKELVLANWGGDAGKALVAAFLDSFSKETGIAGANDGSGTSGGKIKAMVESGKITWDVMDTGTAVVQLGEEGFLEEIDYSIVDKSKVFEGFAYKYAIANYLFSYVLDYDKVALKDNEPKTWADFWNLKDFPGKRALRKGVEGMLEIALMADGVPIDKLYPIDEKRAFAKLREIKKDCFFWANGAESQQMLREGEVTMGVMWSTRVNALKQDTDGRCVWTWNQGLLCPGVWAVPKGNPAGKDAFRFIAWAQDPQRQIELFKMMNGSPANPAAAALMPPELVPLDPGHPDNAKLQAKMDAEWYGKNQIRLNDQYLDFIAS